MNVGCPSNPGPARSSEATMAPGNTLMQASKVRLLVGILAPMLALQFFLCGSNLVRSNYK